MKSSGLIKRGHHLWSGLWSRDTAARMRLPQVGCVTHVCEPVSRQRQLEIDGVNELVAAPPNVL